MTKVYNDLLLAADVGQVSADITAAFDSIYSLDTVDHQLLLHRLERQYGLCGVALAWLGRPYVVTGGLTLYKMLVMFFFATRSPSSLDRSP